MAGTGQLIPGSILRPWTTFFVVLGAVVDSSLWFVMHRQGQPATILYSFEAGFTLLSAGLAWFFARTVALTIAISESGVTVTERVLNRPWRATRRVPWRDFTEVEYTRGQLLFGLVALSTTNPARPVILSKKQARAVLLNPDCRLRPLPPSVSKWLGRSG